ncbi:unnamed protein product [Aspergillus oryzae]|nr:unnamed protein product [Aspergillus oryzae]
MEAFNTAGEVHYVLANTCTSYITVVAHQFNECDFEEGYDKIAYLEYSSRYWIAHFRQTCVREESPLLTHAQSICDPNSDVYQMWSWIYANLGRNLPHDATTLLIASCLGLADIVNVLARETVEFNSQDSGYGRTTISWAAENGYEAVVKLLLATGKVDIDSKDSNSRIPLFWAAKNGHRTVVELLIGTEKVDIDSRDSWGLALLYLAANNGDEAVVELLLATGKVDIDARDSDGQTPLSCAARNGHEAVVKLLQEFHQLAL